MENDLFYKVALNRLPGVGHAAVKHLTSYLGTAEEIFRASPTKLQKVPGIGNVLTKEILNQSSFHEAEDIITKCEKLDISILYYTDETFPSQLKSIYDAPTLIYFKGNLDNINGRNLGIVGTRKATSYGKEVTRKVVRDSAPLDLTIISGLAYGIDIEAHRAALKYKIPTYAVLASGVDTIYPDQHTKAAQEMTELGGLISENPPGTKPDARLFPARNRIIAGLCDATLVVEAASKGGALITANIANSYDKAVFAVPGNLGSDASEGTNKLIAQQRAMAYTGIEDLKFQMNWGENMAVSPSQHKISSFDLSPEERAIISLMQEHQDGIEIDEISWKAQIPLNQLASILLTMEFNGLVKMLPGKKYAAAYSF